MAPRLRSPNSVWISHFASLLLAAILAQCLLYANNTGRHQSRWVNGKLAYSDGLMGSKEALLGRQMFAQNQLNLGAWHGYHEMHFDSMLPISAVEWDLKLPADSYLDFEFEKGPEGFMGIRFSRHPRYPSQYFVADSSRKILVKNPRDWPEIASGAVRAKVTLQGQQVVLHLNGHPIDSFAHAATSLSVVAFRGSMQGAVVDNVTLYRADGSILAKEDFSLNRYFFRTWFAILGVLILVEVLLWLGFRGSAVGTQNFWLWILRPKIALVSVFLALFVVDFYLWSSRYTQLAPKSWKLEPWNDGWLESVRAAAALSLGRWVLPQPSAPQVPQFLNFEKGPGLLRYSPMVVFGTADPQFEILPNSPDALSAFVKNHSRGAHLVVLLGTSQTWGIGASKDQRVAVQLHKALYRGVQDKRPVVVLNLSIYASHGREVIHRYVHAFPWLRPEVTIANFSNNDLDTQELVLALQLLVGHNRKFGGKTILSAEPNSDELPLVPHVRNNHEAIEKVAKGENTAVFFLDTHHNLSNAPYQNSGQLFWDIVHLTAHGQELLAKIFANAILKVQAGDSI
jgi:lysophospholipase L1-like esterase